MVFRGFIVDESHVHILGFSLWGSVKLPFFESCTIKQCSSVIPSQSQRVFGGVFGLKVVCLKGDGVDAIYYIMVWDRHWIPRLA